MASPDGRKHPLDERSGRRNHSHRKLARDGKTWTPTEQRKRDLLMKQFCRHGRKGVQVMSGNSEEYKRNFDLIDWSKR